MATVMLKVEELLFPKRTEYVRGTVKKENVDRLRAALTGKDWPFPPILVRKLDKPEKRKGREYHYKIVDGVTRTTVAMLEKRPTIPAVTEKMTDVESDITQLRTNLTHGMLVDRKHRDAWVRFLVKERKVKPATLARELHLTERSIFRMAKGTQTKTGPRKLAKRRAAAAKEAAEKNGRVEWTAADFFSSLHALYKDSKGHNDAIMEYAKQHKDKLSGWLDPFMDVLAGQS